MGNDLTHALKLLQTFREAGLNPSTIESVIQGMQIGDIEKHTISILNQGLAKEEVKFPNHRLKNYFCYKTASEDYRKEFDPGNLVAYIAQTSNISYN